MRKNTKREFQLRREVCRLFCVDYSIPSTPRFRSMTYLIHRSLTLPFLSFLFLSSENSKYLFHINWASKLIDCKDASCKVGRSGNINLNFNIFSVSCVSKRLIKLKVNNNNHIQNWVVVVVSVCYRSTIMTCLCIIQPSTLVCC